jgi:hypothetical protein
VTRPTYGVAVKAERAEIRAREEPQREHEAALVDDLRQMARAWKESQIVHEFLDRAEPAVSAIDDEDRERRLEWLAWARHRADEMNPLRTPGDIAKVLLVT